MIVGARVEEILVNVWSQLQLSGYEDKLFSGVILTGGGANLKNIEEAFRKTSKIEKVKTAKYVHFSTHGYSDTVKKDCSQNTLLGLLAAGNENCCLQEKETVSPTPTYDYQQGTDIFKDDVDLKQQEEENRKRIEAEKKEEEKRKKKEEEKRRKEEEKAAKAAKAQERANKSNKFTSLFKEFTDNFFDDDKME
jgi:cell division protein FtsA